MFLKLPFAVSFSILYIDIYGEKNKWFYCLFIIEAQRLNINPPGRPIVSGIGTLTEYVSAFVERELQPLLANIPSYIKHTTDFLNKVSRFDNLPINTIFCFH